MKYLKKSLFFLILAILVLLIGNFFLSRARKVCNEFALNRNVIEAKLRNESENTIDILVLGDSEGFSSVSPMQIWTDKGYTTFNASQIGQTPIDELSMLEVALQKQQPKVLLLETNAIFQEGATANTAFTTFVNQYLHLFRYHNEWKDLTGYKFQQDASYKGFAIRAAVVPYTGDSNYMEANRTNGAYVSKINRTYLDLVREKCEKNGISLVLYSVPSPTNYNMEKHEWLQNYADENSINYIDYNLLTEEIGLDWSKDALDGGDHVNISGAQKLTKHLEEYLAERYDLSDHRSESADYVNAWNTEAAEYNGNAEMQISAIRGTN